MPIRVRMTAWYVALLALVIAAVGVFIVVRLRSDLTESIDRTLRPATSQIATGYAREGDTEFRDSSASLLAGERAAAQVLARDGRVVLAYGDPAGRVALIRDGQRAAALHAGLEPRTIHGAGGAAFRVAARPVIRRGTRQVVVAAISTAPVQRSVDRVLTLLLIALPAALLLTALGGWWLARRALRPIDRMTSEAAAIDAGRLGERIADPETRDEVGHLATTLNSMLARTQAGVEEQRRLVADASHELRTPLAAMRSELDVSLRLDDLAPAARGVLESTRDEVDRLTRTVNDLLTLAAVDARQLSLRRDPVDLQALAAEVAAAVAPLAERKRIGLDVQGSPAAALGDPDALRQVVRNLVENAIDFSPDGGRVELKAATRAGAASLTVGDQGPGIAAEHRERIFERFYRADPSRTRATGGSGLGLAIARELIEAQGGEISVRARNPTGSEFQVELPTLE